MTMEIKVDVTHKEMDAEDREREKLRRFFVLCGAKLHSIYTEESKQRADGLGGLDGAKDTGTLSNSIAIMKQDDTSVLVGTNLEYARKLAFGEPDPGANLDAIMTWRRRKNIPRRGKQVWKKVRTKGPTANPFHERTIIRFREEYKRIRKEVFGE